MKKHLPNILTLSNQLSGIIGIVLAFEGQLLYAAIAIWVGAVFDFFDGFVARLVKSDSELGKQLDSLADMITFGLLPAVIVYQLLLPHLDNQYLAGIAFLIALFTALRLAKFNIDERQTTEFIGLPSPASAIFISALPFYVESATFSFLINPVSLILVSIIISLLMVSEIRLFSFKIKNLSWSKDKWRINLLIIAVILFFILQVLSLPLIIILYFLFSLLNNNSHKK